MWIDALNAQALWDETFQAREWISRVGGTSFDFQGDEVNSLISVLNFMREQLTNLRFGLKVESSEIDARLKGVSVMFSDRASQTPGDGLSLFRALPMGKTDKNVIRSIVETLLLQFAQYAGDALGPGSHFEVARCEGLIRKGKSLVQSPPLILPRLEAKWRSEISLLKEADPEIAATLSRCELFFVARGKMRFCSDACRFSTFQITRQIKQPGYSAEKQKRYRSRKGQS